MTASLLFALTGTLLFVIGLQALVVREHLMRKLLALNVMSSGVFLVVAALAGRAADGSFDPVPQALVITGIVVAVAATAVGLALMLRIHAATGRAALSTRASPTLPRTVDDGQPARRAE